MLSLKPLCYMMPCTAWWLRCSWCHPYEFFKRRAHVPHIPPSFQSISCFHIGMFMPWLWYSSIWIHACHPTQILHYSEHEAQRWGVYPRPRQGGRHGHNQQLGLNPSIPFTVKFKPGDSTGSLSVTGYVSPMHRYVGLLVCILKIGF